MDPVLCLRERFLGWNSNTEEMMVEELLNLESGLSDWEVKFIESIVGVLEVGEDLTKRQEDKLNEIYDAHFGSGT